ncbi:hypothetical protein [Natronococcus occultus]|uniref:DUF8215 domain-containing protein n=1 Tax=Natronococcus occultus SP4 TaxID=694430 RepID=L0K4S7_9EURY|nr:hypothetical protein [Natronococcus occultus]AGB39560.1 hypothetical protein Natoc_3859 [Natronococcus occultus SP4]
MGRDRRNRPPGRRTRPAETRTRRSWYGYGKLATVEKSRFGCFLHDVTSIFGEVSILGLPALLLVAMTDPASGAVVTGAALVAWIVMVIVGALVRGGWIRPLGTETLGWVTLSAALIGLRLGYYNAVLLLGGYGGALLGTVLGTTWIAPVAAAAIGAGAMLAFPALGERVARARRQ